MPRKQPSREVLLEKQYAINKVASNTPPSWRMIAETAFTLVAQENETFTTDEVWEKIDGWGYGKVERRRLGPVAQDLIRDKFMERIDYVLSSRKVCHGRPIPLYKRIK